MNKNLNKNSYMAWNQYYFKADYELCPLLGEWDWFDSFEELEKEVKTTYMNRLLNCIFEIEEDLTVEEIVKREIPKLGKIEKNVLLDLLEFVNSKDDNLERLNYKWYHLRLKIKDTFDSEYYQLELFSSPQEAINLLQIHYKKCGLQKTNEEIEADLESSFGDDIA